jgi:hypothetical protein
MIYVCKVSVEQIILVVDEEAWRKGKFVGGKPFVVK